MNKLLKKEKFQLDAVNWSCISVCRVYISLPFYCFLFVLLNYKFGSSWQYF